MIPTVFYVFFQKSYNFTYPYSEFQQLQALDVVLSVRLEKWCAACKPCSIFIVGHIEQTSTALFFRN